MSRVLRDKTEVSWNRLVPRTVGRAWFNVALAVAAVGFIAASFIVSYDGRWQTGVPFGVALVCSLTLVPRAIAGLVILRREAAARDR
ncbi:hypothetical protein [Amycolatopsis saalfeldensis]|uniref:Uncharacterized protein n=1 Tax=Amycolatopsis saalfeldensis TaxID=394193 RepID=A0A1H8U2Z3_9PSEU|nr:hypothetical protein [Amycolatopsis saalfeldensis]SEO97619.1 hypothetical protein SAMN04489732_10347 [Amycolatopsis saalfeldensis]